MRSLILSGLVVVLASPAAAQSRMFVEGRVGMAVPTFDIADVATSGTAFGGTLGYRLGDRMTLMGEVDFGMHKDEPTETVDIQTRHYMAKLGLRVAGSEAGKWDVSLNLGAGAVTFAIEDGPSYTYPAINAGAKIAYRFSPSLALVVSPQGDIAFTDEDELTTTNAWVWPVTAGLRITF